MEKGSTATTAVSEPAEQRVDKNFVMSTFAMTKPGVGVDVDEA